jgi:hypothetical protein
MDYRELPVETGHVVLISGGCKPSAGFAGSVPCFSPSSVFLPF